MNIFYLDEDPTTAAQWQCDRHVVKMILESAQMLSTAHRELDGDDAADALNMYKRTHVNHPSTIWCRSGKQQYDWLYQHFYALCDEYRYRYGKEHLTWRKLGEPLSHSPAGIDVGAPFTQATQAMPDIYKADCSVQAYRNYYRLDKSFNSWFSYNKSRCRPWWLAS